MKLLIRLSIIVALVAATSLSVADSAFAQCAMCRASVAGNSAFAKSLNLGVLVLLAPPVALFCAFLVIAFRHRK